MSPTPIFNEKATEKLRQAVRYPSLKGREQIVAEAIDEGADMNRRYALDQSTNNTTCALAESMHFKKYPLAKLLVERGANVDNTDHLGATPLYIAAKYGNLEMVQLLLDHNADVDRAIPKFNPQRAQPRWEAGSKEVYNAPIHIAIPEDAQSVTEDTLKIVTALVEHGADLSVRNDKGQTAAQRAASILGAGHPVASYLAAAEQEQAQGGYLEKLDSKPQPQPSPEKLLESEPGKAWARAIAQRAIDSGKMQRG